MRKKKCLYCDREISLSNYNTHVSSCLNQKKPSFIVDEWFDGNGYQCPKCSYFDVRKKALVSHYHRKHTKDGQDLIQRVKPWQYASQKPIWNKGLTKSQHPSLKKLSDSLVGRTGTFNGRKHTRKTKQKMRESTIRYIQDHHLDGDLMVPRKGRYESEIISFLEDSLSISIDTNMQILGYFPDGFISDLGICLEIDESFHFESEHHRNRDLQKDEDYRNAGLFIFRIPEKKWLENRSWILENFQFFISQVESYYEYS
jgi:very-short-patch-repair endonuclease